MFFGESRVKEKSESCCSFAIGLFERTCHQPGILESHFGQLYALNRVLIRFLVLNGELLGNGLYKTGEKYGQIGTDLCYIW